MGCTSSRQARHDGRAFALGQRTKSLPIRSSFSGSFLKRHHHHKYDEQHNDDEHVSEEEVMMKSTHDKPWVHPELLSKEVDKAKAWSQQVQRRIPKTPSVTPPNEPEVINAWELMEGLDDPVYRSVPVPAQRSFSFHAASLEKISTAMPPASLPVDEHHGPLPSPQWMLSADGQESEPSVSDFDQEILSSFREALENFSLTRRSSLTAENTADSESEDDASAGIVQTRIRDFQQKINVRRAKVKSNVIDSEGKVVFYFTSIRGVRKTYEDCWAVRVILKGYGVRIDERDVSMDSGFKDELNQILGAGFGGNPLPRIFADGEYLGGAEDVRHLHEIGELGEVLEGCEKLLVGKLGIEVACDGCADVRFVPCETCSGSCKVFVVDKDEEGFEGDYGSFQRCQDCNENGLVRCSICC